MVERPEEINKCNRNFEESAEKNEYRGRVLQKARGLVRVPT